MKTENTKNVIIKNKKRTRIICYISLVVLVILLFIPPAFRAFIKEKQVEEKKSVVLILSCNKLDESISSTFLNDEPQNLLYKIKGDKTITIAPDEETGATIGVVDNLDDNPPTDDPTNQTENQVETIDPNNPNSTDSKESLYEILKPYSVVSYDEESDTTSVRTNMPDLRGYGYYQPLFGTASNQQNLFQNYGFTCTSTIQTFSQ